MVSSEEDHTNVRDENANLDKFSLQRFWDAITKEELQAVLTADAREVFMEDWKNWDEVPVNK